MSGIKAQANVERDLPAQYDPFFYRTQDGSELDFVLCKGNDIVLTAEIKHSNSPGLSRGNTLAIAKLNCKNNYIITPSSDQYPLREHTQVISLRDFLLTFP